MADSPPPPPSAGAVARAAAAGTAAAASGAPPLPPNVDADPPPPLLIIGATGELGAATLLAARAASPRRTIHATLHATPAAAAAAAAASAWHPLDTGDHAVLRRLIIDTAPGEVVYCAVPRGHGGANSTGGGAGAAPFRGGVVEDVAAAAEAVAMAGGRFVGVSTDVVFDGRGGAPYAEADPVHPLGAYGACKAEMEGRLTAMGDNVLVCRTSLILSMAGAGGGGLPRSASSNGSDGGTGGGTGGGGGAVGGAAAAPAAAPAAAEAAEGATMATATPTTAAAADAATPAAATAADDVPPAALASLDVPMGKGLRFVADCVAGRKGAIALFTDELRQMSWADDLGAALVELAARRGVGGVLHLVADAPTTRWEVACVLARRAGLPAAGAALSGLSTESGLGRPVDLRLSTERLASLGLRTRLRGAIERLEALP